ncbi:hypothetical protein AGMMS49921_13960 [Endomicrobiia bacterium]|nr:hypothetical protein AGMMS49921_13960 [Endomicrobiia bacterium]
MEEIENIGMGIEDRRVTVWNNKAAVTEKFGKEEEYADRIQAAFNDLILS